MFEGEREETVASVRVYDGVHTEESCVAMLLWEGEKRLREWGGVVLTRCECQRATPSVRKQAQAQPSPFVSPNCSQLND